MDDASVKRYVLWDGEDAELRVIGACIEILSELPPDDADRAVSYLWERFAGPQKPRARAGSNLATTPEDTP